MNLPDPAPILNLSTAYWGSQALLTANRIGLFPALGGGERSVEQLAKELGVAVRPLGLLLGALQSLGLVEAREGSYGNTPLSAAYLVPGGPGYLGQALHYAADLYGPWGQLEQSLRRDAPVLPQESYLGQDPERTRHFVHGMHNRALGIGRALVGLADLTGRKKLLDVGGGPGTYSALLCQRHPGLKAVVLDLPGVVEVAREIVTDLGAGEAVSFLAGDYHQTPFPEGFDALLISGVFHRESPDTCRELIRRGVAALEPGGLLLVADVFTDPDGGPPFAALFGLNMLLSAPQGGVHGHDRVADWFRQAGLEGVSVQPFPGGMPHRLVTGVRP